ncbi:MAG: hypothetical protein Q7K45_06420 [Nanoarchaeota archaeon]|nr:hypothetical protein [Nanoarchaeota archaeon]
MKEITLNVSGCTTALQFLDTVGKSLGKPLQNFSVLDHYLQKNYYSKITLVGMKEFSAHCPHATREINAILDGVQKHFQQEGKKFEYCLEP